MVLRVTQYGEPILRQRGSTVETFDARLREFADDMIATMRANEGIGLAANQVGDERMICVVDPGLTDPPFRCVLDDREPPIDLLLPLVLVNPVAETQGEKVVFEEGCLSIPDVRGEVERPDEVRVTYQDLDGHAHELEANGLMARVILHEVDHLNGVMFVDLLAPRDRKAVQRKLDKLEQAVGRAS